MVSSVRKKKKRKRNQILDWAAYVALRGLIVFLSIFKIETNLKTARLLGRLLWRHYHRGRKRAFDNIKASFPEKNDEWCRKTGQRSFEQIAMMAMDTLFTTKLITRSNWLQYSKNVNMERTKWLMQEGKGLLMIAAHYGNFEVLGYMIGLFGFNAYSIARPLDNRFISKYLYSVRQQAGQKILDKKGASERMDEIMRSGATLAFIADQDAGRKGVFVDFFGRKASTYKSIGLVAMTYNVPIAIIYSRRIGDKFFFEIGIQRLIMPAEWADKDEPLQWITAEYTKAIEDFVREDPSQYWWLHRRWKHRPKGEK